jgi:hypothetical protein
MPRRHRRRPQADDGPARPPRTTTEIGAPAGWSAHRHKGGEDGPDYTCPRCRRSVARRSEHVVAWRPDDEDQLHRHWHTECWTSAVREGIERYRWG